MALTIQQQIIDLIQKNKSVLIVFKQDYTGDALGSGLALKQALEKMHKQVDLVCSDFKLCQKLEFLDVQEVKPELTNLQKVTLSINTKENPISEIYYEKTEDRLKIHLDPKHSNFELKKIHTELSRYKYDLIITLDTQDLESLGHIYSNNLDFFAARPIINLDSSAQNEQYAEINLIQLTSASTSEIVYALIKKLIPDKITNNMATNLLTGLICATKNFKSHNIKSKTLETASHLIDQGADREKIIRHIYQNRYVSTLKLWGQVLTRLSSSLEDRLVWSNISLQDFIDTQTTPAELHDVIDELIVSLPRAEVVILNYEVKNNGDNAIKSIVYSIKNHDARFLAKKFEAKGSQETAKFTLHNISLIEAQKQIVEEIKSKM